MRHSNRRHGGSHGKRVRSPDPGDEGTERSRYLDKGRRRGGRCFAERIAMNQKEIKELIELLVEKDIAEFEIERGDVKLHIKRGGVQVAALAVQATPVAASAAPAETVPAAAAPKSAAVAPLPAAD